MRRSQFQLERLRAERERVATMVDVRRVEQPLEADLDGKQDVLVSGVSIKTVNGVSLLGSGNLSIAGTGGSGSIGFDDNEGVWIMDEGEL